MHPLTNKLLYFPTIENPQVVFQVIKSDADKIITDYLRERAEWLKKEVGRNYTFPSFMDAIYQSFELSDEKVFFPDKAFEPSISGCKVVFCSCLDASYFPLLCSKCGLQRKLLRELPAKIIIKGKVFKEDSDICRTINTLIDYLSEREGL